MRLFAAVARFTLLLLGCATLMVSAAALYLFLSRTEGPLQLWHTETLTCSAVRAHLGYTNQSPDSATVVLRRKPALSSVASSEPLAESWPAGVISLSHVALPFPPDDPLYGQARRGDDGAVFLGQIAVKGERGLLLFPSDWLLRLRHNPFYKFLERRTLEWIGGTARPARPVGADAVSPSAR